MHSAALSMGERMTQFFANPQLPLARGFELPFRHHNPVEPDRAVGGRLKFLGDLLELEALDDVAYPDIVIVRDRDTAIVAFLDFADVVLEPLQLRDVPLVDHDVVTQKPDLPRPA